MTKLKNEKISFMVKVAIFSSLSVIFYYIKFPIALIIPFLPQFLQVQFSNLPAIIGGLNLGPLGGVLIIIIRTLVKLPSSSTFFVGELADLLIGLAVVLTSSIFYRSNKTKKGIFIGLLLSTLAWVIVACLVNWKILAPFYLRVFNMDIQAFIQFLPKLKNIVVDETNYMQVYLFICILPFNFLLSTIINIITYIVYNRILIIVK